MAFTNAGTIKSINGVTVREPRTHKYTLQTINDSDAGRSDSGKWYGGIIGYAVTLDLGWTACSPDETNAIINALTAAAEFPVEYFDPRVGDYVTANFYVGDRTANFTQFWIGGECFELGAQLIQCELDHLTTTTTTTTG